jgi:predicted transporter
MGARALIGAAMILVGGLILARGLSYTKRNDVVNLGAIKVSTDEKKAIPPWIGGALAVAGLVVIFSGAGRRS